MASQSSESSTSSNSSKEVTFKVPAEFFILKGPSSTKDSYKFTCQRCMSVISCSYKSRYNLTQHIKSKHTQALHKFQSLCGALDGRKKSGAAADIDIEVVPSTSADVEEVTKRKSVDDFFQIPLNQKRLDEFIVDYLMESVLPFNHVSSDAFQNFVKRLAPKLKVKSRDTYKGYSAQKLVDLKSQLVKNFSTTEKVCIVTYI